MKRVMVVLATSLSVVACTGTKGDTGPAGPAGAAGPAGVAGPAGAAGSVGSPGAMGSVGTMGTAGAMGTPGAMGTAGAMGTPGTMGVAGLDGQSVHVSALDAGSQCAGGGALLTSSDGGTVTVCNGTPADTYLYGDGSAGPLVISTDTEWIDPILNNGVPANLQFTDVTINAGVTFTVISGLTIKASGSFVNNGLIVVNSWGGAGGQDMEEEPVSTGGATVPVTTRAIPAHPGISRSSAVAGYRTRRATASGGQGGSGVWSGQARQMVKFGVVGGGGGAPGPAGYGGSGGGTLTILAKNLLRNAGNIRADGQSSMFTCSGGGGGGIVVLSSASTIENTGAVRARGGHGGESETTVCSGGGGGSGGLVHFVAPNIISGTRIVAPGLGGPVNGAPVNRSLLASPGGGGGATATSGGWGGALNNELLPGADGTEGVVLDTQANPASLFF